MGINQKKTDGKFEQTIDGVTFELYPLVEGNYDPYVRGIHMSVSANVGRKNENRTPPSLDEITDLPLHDRVMSAKSKTEDKFRERNIKDEYPVRNIRHSPDNSFEMRAWYNDTNSGFPGNYRVAANGVLNTASSTLATKRVEERRKGSDNVEKALLAMQEVSGEGQFPPELINQALEYVRWVRDGGLKKQHEDGLKRLKDRLSGRGSASLESGRG